MHALAATVGITILLLAIPRVRSFTAPHGGPSVPKAAFSEVPCLASVVSSRYPTGKHVVRPVQESAQLRCRVRLMQSAGENLLPSIRDGVEELGCMEEWRGSVEALSAAAGIGAEEAERCLADAWGWRAWAISTPTMRKYIKPQRPDEGMVTMYISWMQDGPLEFDRDQLRRALVESPKAYLGSDPEKTYKMALAAAPKQYKDPAKFKALLMEDPSVIRCTYNCSEEGCASECGNCWVTYKNTK